MRALRTAGLSERRACWLTRCPRGTAAYRCKPKDDTVLSERLQALAAQRIRFGYRRLHILLRREGIQVGETRLRRVYRQANLQVHPRRKRHVRYVRGNAIARPTRLNQLWAADFLHDQMLSGRRVRVLQVIDSLSRKNLALEPDVSLPSARVISIFDDIARERGYPEGIRIDHGTEFTSLVMLRWAAAHNVALHFIDPGKPTQNAHIESCNGRVRDEFFNVHAFWTLQQVRDAAAVWRTDYNAVRPHSSLANRTPEEFEEQFLTCATPQLQVA